MALPGLTKSSGLEGLMVKSNLTPYELLENTKQELDLTQGDVIYLSANYLNENMRMNFMKNHKKFNISLNDLNKYLIKLSSYPSVNYNQETFATYKLGLNYVEKAKLDFQIMLSAVNSEHLLREFLTIMKDNKELYLRFNHPELAVSFVNSFGSISRPNGKSFLGTYGDIELDGEKLCGEADYTIKLDKLIKKGTSTDFIIDHILKNAYKNFFLSSPDNC